MEVVGRTDAGNKGVGSDSFGCDNSRVVNNVDDKRNVTSNGGQWNQDQQSSFLANLHAIFVLQCQRRFSLHQELKSFLELRRHVGVIDSCQPPFFHSSRKDHLGDPSLAFFV